MTLDELRQKRLELQSSIQDLVDEFEKETGMQVEIRVDRVNVSVSSGRVTSTVAVIEVEVSL